MKRVLIAVLVIAACAPAYAAAKRTELDGVWRGILAHISASGAVTECEPSGPNQITLSNWTATAAPGFQYPQVVSASCGSLSMTWTADRTTIVGAEELLDGFETTNTAGHSSVPGAVAIMQHLRDRGSYGQTPCGGAWPACPR